MKVFFIFILSVLFIGNAYSDDLIPPDKLVEGYLKDRNLTRHSTYDEVVTAVSKGGSEVTFLDKGKCRSSFFDQAGCKSVVGMLEMPCENGRGYCRPNKGRRQNIGHEVWSRGIGIAFHFDGEGRMSLIELMYRFETEN